MTEQEQAMEKLIEAARPVAALAKYWRHYDYEVDARVPAQLLIDLDEALAAVDEAREKE